MFIVGQHRQDLDVSGKITTPSVGHVTVRSVVQSVVEVTWKRS